MLKRVPDVVLSILLIVVGVLSIVLTIGTTFQLNIPWLPTTQNPNVLILGVIGIVAVALGMERVLQFYQIQQQLQEVRQQLTDMIEGMSQSLDTFFLDEFPPAFWQDFEAAKESWLVGVTMASVIKYSFIEQKLRKGHTIHVLLVNPDGKAIEIAENRMYGRPDVERRRKNTRSILQDLCELQALGKGKLEIRTIENPLAFEAVALSRESATGILYLTHYPFKVQSKSGPKPKFILRAKDRRWYKLFNDEISNLWTCGTPWPRNEPVEETQSNK